MEDEGRGWKVNLKSMDFFLRWRKLPEIDCGDGCDYPKPTELRTVNRLTVWYVTISPIKLLQKNPVNHTEPLSKL